MNTPWGPSQQIEQVIEGILSVSTAGHGGFKLEPRLNRRMPEYLRQAGGWYEEDCAWCLPAVVFEAEILARGSVFWQNALRGGGHMQTMKNWFPDEYEKHFGTEIPPGESFQKDRRLFQQDHAGDYVGICAFGDWKEGVPKGFVGVVARLGGRPDPGLEKCFLVPQEEYADRGEHGFVIDLAHHAEVPRIGGFSQRVA